MRFTQWSSILSSTRVDDRGHAFGGEFGESPGQSGVKILNLFRQRKRLLVVRELGVHSGLHEVRVERFGDVVHSTQRQAS